MPQDDWQWLARAKGLGITVSQRSKTVWIAQGAYRGRQFQVKGRSPNIALSLWKEAVGYAGTENAPPPDR
jgi:hypothetical protein